ncbi:Sua5/YciO/YrdC/YwlC family protein, partial [bacterium]|nr:Sua5/YciO/YrdC/YwlC family protein [bacterium]
MTRERLQVRVVGLVQGVGFRPFVHRLARDLALAGWIRNDGDGVTIEVEGDAEALPRFVDRLSADRPPASLLYALDRRFVPVTGEASFEILPSESTGPPRAWVLPDLATCPACRDDVRDPANRRHRYPFTNCTHCGPRFTIVEGLPYDRARTTMRAFPMCDACAAEYADPEDRRFHAQPNACAVCGPRVSFRERGAGGEREASEDAAACVGNDALAAAVTTIRAGRILALKGLGGYHLVVDARNEEAVAELRRRKRRPYKPLAVMMPDLETLRRHVDVPAYAESLLVSSQAPIVLLPWRPDAAPAGGVFGPSSAAGHADGIAPSVAPGMPSLGVFLPYTPLH